MNVFNYCVYFKRECCFYGDGLCFQILFLLINFPGISKVIFLFPVNLKHYFVISNDLKRESFGGTLNKIRNTLKITDTDT